MNLLSLFKNIHSIEYRNKSIRGLCFLVVIIYTLSSCNTQNDKEKNIAMLDNYSIKENKKIEFILGDSITNSIISFEYLEKDKFGLENDQIVTLDYPTGSLNFFDVRTNKVVRVVKPATEGPNSIGPKLNGFHVITLDSIITVGSYFFSIIDSRGKLYYQHNFAKENGGLPALPQINNGAVVVEEDGKFILNSAPDIQVLNPNSFSDKQCIKILNTKNSSVETELEYPDKYHDGSYGPNYASFYNAYDDDNKRYVVSFPNDNMVYSSYINNFNGKESHWGGSKYFKRIEPMKLSYPENDNFEYYTRFYVQNPSYGHIFYDKFRKLYYRVAFRPVTEDRYSDGVRWKPKSLIIFNNELARIGEVDLPEDTNPSEIEPVRDGLMIHAGGEDENKLTFKLFTLIKRK